MKRNYYYLVAGLPDLLRGRSSKKLQAHTLRAEILQELDPADQRLVRYLCHRYDNDNCLALLAGRKQFDHRGFFSREVLEFRLETLEGLPSYLCEYLQNRKDEVRLFSTLTKEDELHALYYESLRSMNNSFVNAWAEFDLNMHNFFGARNADILGKEREKSVLPLNETAERILKSTASDFGMSAQHPWVEEVLSNYDTPIDLENSRDRIIWNTLDELTQGYTFTVEVVLAFIIKLHTVERWNNLNSERAEKRLKELLQETKSMVQLKK
ncbi:DUF2764 family protein [Chitinivibrio alkaliphilus]|uniref:V-type ATPase, subunit C n=1 Tax=Chitinivibrio alkaliphilus ACht1 TaxID=1313304 RepID=U7D5R9_9BACT|nr:DUF2764 family protein [Chitinivibrio alkaliphilus]ERP31839.1 V-type ATPase, subunit C [Chitinivibrio alkaliphilus ACht1]